GFEKRKIENRPRPLEGLGTRIERIGRIGFRKGVS
ncbi:unnamed protein product, partial [Linum tenue]